MPIGIALIASMNTLGCAKEDPNEAANALFVEGTRLLADAAKAKYDGAMSLYRDGFAKFDLIVTRYPASNLAVQLASGQQIGSLRFQRILMNTGSMKPTFNESEKLVIVFRAADGPAPQQGDIVLFLLPKDNGTSYAKRIVGLPGDRVRMIEGALHINGQPVKRERIDDFIENDGRGNAAPVKRWRETLANGATYTTLKLIDNGFYDNTQEYLVPLDHYFVMGDNRDNSTDSRVLSEVGYIPFANFLGRVFRR